MQLPRKHHQGCAVEYGSALWAAAPVVKQAILDQMDPDTCIMSTLTNELVRTWFAADLGKWLRGELGPRYDPADLPTHPAIYLDAWTAPAPIVTHHLCRVELGVMARKVGLELGGHVRDPSVWGFTCDYTGLTDELCALFTASAVMTWFSSASPQRSPEHSANHSPQWETPYSF